MSCLVVYCRVTQPWKHCMFSGESLMNIASRTRFCYRARHIRIISNYFTFDLCVVIRKRFLKFASKRSESIFIRENLVPRARDRRTRKKKRFDLSVTISSWKSAWRSNQSHLLYDKDIINMMIHKRLFNTTTPVEVFFKIRKPSKIWHSNSTDRV